MSDKKIATRQSYGEKLAELGEKNENINRNKKSGKNTRSKRGI